MESYAKGETEPALLEETIGANFERTVAAYADREALVEFATGRRWTYAELDRDVERARPRPDRRPASRRATGSASGRPNCAEWTIAQYATAKIGAILVNVNPAYRTHEFSYAVNQSGLRLLIAATAFKTSDYRAMVEETAGDEPARLERVVYIGTDDWDDAGRRGRAAADADAVSRADGDARARTTRSTSSTRRGTTGYPKGATLSHRNILNNGFFVTELINFTDEDRLCIPVPFYHCFGMVMGNLGCTTHGATMVIPAPGFDPGDHAARRSPRSGAPACTACRRCSSRCRTTRRSPTTTCPRLRTGIMAGSICPVEVMKRCVNDMHMAEVVDRLRDDRDLAGLVPDPRRRRPRASYGDDRAGPPARRDQDRRPGHRRDRRARRAGRVLHPRLLGDARLLGRRRRRPPRRSTPTAGCTPATSPRCARTATATSSAGSRTW